MCIDMTYGPRWAELFTRISGVEPWPAAPADRNSGSTGMPVSCPFENYVNGVGIPIVEFVYDTLVQAVFSGGRFTLSDNHVNSSLTFSLTVTLLHLLARFV